LFSLKILKAELVGKNPDNMQEVYDEIIAEKFEMEKNSLFKSLGSTEFILFIRFQKI
jgi:hypothetical protein